jgi:epoxyqueuosine reductase QueG
MLSSSININAVIQKFLSSDQNSLPGFPGENAWEDGLIGFSSGADPLYERLKTDIGPFYWTPMEIFSLTFPDIPVRPGELTVISWVLPQTRSTKTDQHRQRKYPAERWYRSRTFGEETNLNLARHLTALLGRKNHYAVAPVLSPFWGWQTSTRYGFASNWSERHAAHISGLGTFGLCDGLITEKGKAMRCGSVIAKIAIEPTPRRYRHHHDYCLFYATGKCSKCISRCPAGAITERGHDKNACKKYLFEITSEYAKKNYGFNSYGCGLCQTAVPCESGIPGGLL